jgi:hypothetical protein
MCIKQNIFWNALYDYLDYFFSPYYYLFSKYTHI